MQVIIVMSDDMHEFDISTFHFLSSPGTKQKLSSLHVGQLVSATITNVNEHGVLCLLENGVKGLATMEHIEGMLYILMILG